MRRGGGWTMRDGNVRIQEKFELSLDGRQIASIVVGALVIVAVVFVLGLNVGRQMATRQAAAAPRGDLAALDQVPARDADAKITFYDQLPKNRPPAPPPPLPKTPEAAPAPPPQPEVAPAPTAAAAVAESTPAGGAVTASVSQAAPATPDRAAEPPAPPPAAKHGPVEQRAPAAPSAPSRGKYTVQLSAAPTRADAERLAARYPALSPRVEAAEVPGKGRVYRVRAGRFPDRASAERYLKDVVRETGAKGYVADAR